MKLFISACLLTLSSSALAEGWVIGPRFGHQNLKIHSKGSEYTYFDTSFNSTGPITLTPKKETDEESALVFYNSTVEGLRLGYDMGSFSLVSDLDFARYYLTSGQFDILSLGLGGQYSLIQTPGLKFYSLLGISARSGLIRLYETKFSYNFDDSAGSSETEFDRLNVINYDIGLGLGLPLSEKMSLTFEAKYSDTLSKGALVSESKNVYRNQTDQVEYKSKSTGKNFTLTTQELTMSLLFSL